MVHSLVEELCEACTAVVKGIPSLLLTVGIGYSNLVQFLDCSSHILREMDEYFNLSPIDLIGASTVV